jgi:hypothetical protein
MISRFLNVHRSPYQYLGARDCAMLLCPQRLWRRECFMHSASPTGPRFILHIYIGSLGGIDRYRAEWLLSWRSDMA